VRAPARAWQTARPRAALQRLRLQPARVQAGPRAESAAHGAASAAAARPRRVLRVARPCGGNARMFLSGATRTNRMHLVTSPSENGSVKKQITRYIPNRIFSIVINPKRHDLGTFPATDPCFLHTWALCLDQFLLPREPQLESRPPAHTGVARRPAARPVRRGPRTTHGASGTRADPAPAPWPRGPPSARSPPRRQSRRSLARRACPCRRWAGPRELCNDRARPPRCAGRPSASLAGAAVARAWSPTLAGRL